jgi:hypothetical protein
VTYTVPNSGQRRQGKSRTFGGYLVILRSLAIKVVAQMTIRATQIAITTTTAITRATQTSRMEQSYVLQRLSCNSLSLGPAGNTTMLAGGLSQDDVQRQHLHFRDEYRPNFRL